MRSRDVADALAEAALSGDASAPGFAARFEMVLGRRHRWIAPLARRIFARFGSGLDDAMRRTLVDCIDRDPGFERAWQAQVRPRIRRYPIEPPRMRARKGALAACALPDLATPGDIAAWLGLSIGELDWFTDFGRRDERRDGALAHYHHRWIAKREGYRLIEIPKVRLRDIQRRILHGILDAVPAHAAAHGFVRGRSCRTQAAYHAGKSAVLRMDLRSFFASIAMGRVRAVFATLGYPDAAATVLAALCTHGTPRRVLARFPGAGEGAGLSFDERARLERRHLPQGAPTSPALANLCALHLDLRLQGLAASMECDYTRYADDLALSGGDGLRRAAERLALLIGAIALEEGFEANHRKTRLMPASGRQSIAGIVVNERPNPPREAFDALKATLHNCARFGAASQNRSGHRDFRRHLEGRVAHLRSINARKGEKLALMLREIDWTR